MAVPGSPPLPVRRALISVTDKRGVVELARGLSRLGVEIVSTGGTARTLEAAGVRVRPIEDFTGFPEMLEGRVKTLHPRVHGAVLHRRDLASHQREVDAHGLEPIDLVAVNLYDFARAARPPEAATLEVMEAIDIGGPALLRAAAKNHVSVLPVVDPADYGGVLEALAKAGDVDGSSRRRLAEKVFLHTSRYDAMVAAYFARLRKDEDLPETLSLPLVRALPLRYGENPHQKAAFYRNAALDASGLAAARKIQGKDLSYNNLLDLDAALELVRDLGAVTGQAAAVFIKHSNPSGAAVHPGSVAEALAIARTCDPLSAFGAVVAVNREIDQAAAEVLSEAFVEAVLAPAFDEAALSVFAKKKSLRVLVVDPAEVDRGALVFRSIAGGYLVGTADSGEGFLRETVEARVVTRRAPSEEERRALAFAWTLAKHVRSNAIVFAREDRVVAVGAGQMSRVDSVRICRLKAPEALRGTVCASDAFFPFRDGLDEVAEAGASAVAQPGGSVRDQEVIDAADERGVAMLFTGVRHFRH